MGWAKCLIEKVGQLLFGGGAQNNRRNEGCKLRRERVYRSQNTRAEQHEYLPALPAVGYEAVDGVNDLLPVYGIRLSRPHNRDSARLAGDAQVVGSHASDGEIPGLFYPGGLLPYGR